MDFSTSPPGGSSPGDLLCQIPPGPPGSDEAPGQNPVCCVGERIQHSPGHQEQGLVRAMSVTQCSALFILNDGVEGSNHVWSVQLGMPSQRAAGSSGENTAGARLGALAL